MNTLYRIVANYGYGDKTWISRFLSEQDVCDYFHVNRGFPEDCKLVDLPCDSDFIYYWEVDYEDDFEDWDWQDS